MSERCKHCGKPNQCRHSLAAQQLVEDVLKLLDEYALSYTDSELAQLANSTTGRGEISPQAAEREIRRRAIQRAKENHAR